jgi:hypothetical protein
MGHLAKLVIAMAAPLAVTYGVAGSASAPRIIPGGTAFTLTSTNFNLSVNSAFSHSGAVTRRPRRATYR